MSSHKTITMCNIIVFAIIFCIAELSAFRFYGFGTGYRYLTKEISSFSGVMFDSSSVETKWIQQPLDHFDDKENRTWKMRYFENLQFWKPNSPIYLFIGGEGQASPFWLTWGILYELANETNGAMFGSEHRYYGKSMPLDNSVTENLKYLSAHQALADLAHLLKFIRSSEKFKNSPDSKVVVIGGSYPGMLAAWMRLLYPDLVYAAIASSAPVLAKKDFYEYLETVSDDYEQHGQDGCHDKIREIFLRYEKLFKSRKGIEQLKSEENICDENDMTVLENKQLFFMDKASEFMGRAQYGTPAQIRKHCSRIMNESRVATSKFAYKDEPNFWREESGCYDYDFYNTIDEMREIDWLTSWIYQTCTEFGFYQSTNSDNHPFTRNVPAEIYYKMCTGMFGPEFNEESIDRSIDRTNRFYGGLKPNVTYVVFPNGDMDPWSRLSILEDLSYEAPAKILPMASHCRDLFANRKGDPEEHKEARNYIKYLIKRWLGVGEWYNGQL